LQDTEAVFEFWEELVVRHAVVGKPGHDARLAAAAYAHRLDAILTFDKTGFSPFPG